MNRTAPMLIATALVSGCFGGQNCDRPQAYQKARPTTPIQVPDGLSELDNSRDLKVPVASTPPGAGKGACLEQPPAYSDQMAAKREDD